jgi:hypothetical protein
MIPGIDKLVARFLHGIVAEYRRLEDGSTAGEMQAEAPGEISVTMASTERAPEPDWPMGFSRPPHVE